MSTATFTELEKQIIASIQGDMPIVERPYLAIAERLGVTEDEVLETLRALDRRGVIRRFGATLRHQKSGFRANAMVAYPIDRNLARACAVRVPMRSYWPHASRAPAGVLIWVSGRCSIRRSLRYPREAATSSNYSDMAASAGQRRG